MADEDDGFLSRWARRKQAVREAEAAPAPDAPPAADTAADTAAAEGPADDSQRRPLTPEEVAELPDPDSLEPGSDFKVFLREGVPEELRRRALRRLWRSNPVFGVLDGLNDYDLDYTDAATVVANLRTVFQVGKGVVLPEEEADPEHGAQTDAEDRAPADPPAAEDEAPSGDGGLAEASASTPAPAADAPELAGRTPPPQVAVADGGSRLPDLSALADAPAPAAAETPAAPASPPRPGRAAQRRWGGFAPAPPRPGGRGPGQGGSGAGR